MATRAQLRGAVRERLEDAAASPLWSDAALNEYLAGAVRALGAALPRPATAATAALALGAAAVALPAGVAERGVVAVRDARGRDVPRSSPLPGPAPADGAALGQAWSVWGGTLRLQRPVRGDEAGAWAVDHLAGRELVADEVGQQPVDAGDEPIVVALAAAQAMERRAVEDAKRGASASARAAGEAADRFRAEAAALTLARKRRARGGALAPA